MSKLNFEKLDELKNMNYSFIDNTSFDISKSSEQSNSLKSKLKSRKNPKKSKVSKSSTIAKSSSCVSNKPSTITISPKTNTSTVLPKNEKPITNKYITSINDINNFEKLNKDTIDESDFKNELSTDFTANFNKGNLLNKSGQYDKHFNKKFKEKLIHDSFHLGKGTSKLASNFTAQHESSVPNITGFGIGGYITDEVDKARIKCVDQDDFKTKIYKEAKEITYNFDDYQDTPPIGLTDYNALKRVSKRKYIGLQDKADKYYRIRKYIARNNKDILKTLNRDKSLGFVQRIKLRHMIKKIAKFESHSVSKKIAKIVLKHCLRKCLMPIYTLMFITIITVSLTTPITSGVDTFFDKGDLIKVTNIFGKRHMEKKKAEELARWQEKEEMLAEENAEKAKRLNRDLLPNPEDKDSAQSSDTVVKGHTECSITNSIPSGTKESIAFLEGTKYVGKPYHYGGCTPQDSFDCSGLWYWSFNQKTDIKLPRTADAQGHYVMKHGIWHSASDMKADKIPYGSLLFFKKKGASEIHHVGMYIGKNEKGQHLYYHAPCTGKNLQVAILEYRSDFYGGGLPYN